MITDKEANDKPHKIFDFAGAPLRGRDIDLALGQGDAALPWNASERFPPASWGHRILVKLMRH